MVKFRTSRPTVLGGALFFVLAASLASAQFCNCGPGCQTLSGAVSDSTTGPLLAGNVYLVNGNLSVASGQTLTIGAGAVLKFTSTFVFAVNGTLLVNGTSGSPVIFTSIKDDVVADHNCDLGGTSGAPGQWGRVDFAATSGASVLQSLVVRHAGSGSFAAIRLLGSNLVMTGCSVTSVAGPCLDLTNASAPTVTGCSFDGGTKAVTGVPISSLAGFSGCTASGNSVLDAIELSSGSVASSLTLAKANTLNATGVVVAPLHISVGAGATLTLGAGIVVKFAGTFVFTVDGTLTANGSAGDPVVVTSSVDDAHGGDTNKDGGATSAAAGQWGRVDFNSGSDASSLTHVRLRCGGSGGFASLRLLGGANIAMSSCVVEISAGPCMDLNDASFPTVADCAFDGGTKPVVGARIGALAGFTNCTASGNVSFDAPQLSDATVVGALSLGKVNTLNGSGVIVLPVAASVPVGTSLTLGAGMIFKFTATFTFVVDGTLTANGAAGDPIVFTSLVDDAFGGDTNKDGGATAAAAGQWARLECSAASDASTLTHVRVRCAGSGGFGAIRLTGGANVTLANCSTDLSGGPCIDLLSVSFPTLTNCAFNGGTKAMASVPLPALAGMTGCTASGNAGFDAPELGAATVATSLALTAANTLNANGVIVAPLATTVNAGATLTLGAGIVWKTTSAFVFNVNGTLACNGAPGAPVVFTSIQDDVYGGDTNKDGGATAGAPGQWARLEFNSASDASTLVRTIVRFAGSGGFPAFNLNSADISVTDSEVRSCGGPAIDFNTTARPVFTRCAFVDNANVTADMHISAAAGLRFCTASGNATRDVPTITVGTLTSGETATLRALNSMNGDGVFASTTSITVIAGATANLHAGVILKFTSTFGVVATGTLNILGTGAEPVVLTSIHDDAFGGDTNKNLAATSPAPGQISRCQFGATSTGVAEYLRIRFAGSSGVPGFECASATVTVRSVRADSCQADGFRLTAASGSCDNLVAWDNGTDGVEYNAAVSLKHLTSAFNGGFGVRGLVATPGTIINSIVRDNAAGAFVSVANTQLTYTCGVNLPANFCFDADALFVDGPNGDLTLQPTSPCLGVAEQVTAFFLFKDHVEASRLADGALTGVPFPDLGAYELAPFTMSVTGHPWSGETISFVVEGPTGTCLFFLGNLVGVQFLSPYGFALADFLVFLTPVTFAPVGVPFTIAIPDISAFAGVTFGLQALATLDADPTKGSFTNLYRGVLDG